MIKTAIDKYVTPTMATVSTATEEKSVLARKMIATIIVRTAESENKMPALVFCCFSSVFSRSRPPSIWLLISFCNNSCVSLFAPFSFWSERNTYSGKATPAT